FIISLSETPLILFDEISFGSNQKNDAFKYIVTSSRSNVRDAYAQFRENRLRRASLVATTNEDCFIRDTEGNRRYLAIDLKGTVDLTSSPLPYEGAYAQALYLLDHGFQPKPSHEESQRITEHNRRFMEPNDCEEAVLTFLKKPDDISNSVAMSAGDIMREMGLKSFRGRHVSAIEIGRAMKRLGFESKLIHGTRKYLVTKIDYDTHERTSRQDARLFIPEVF
ncbi:MAG: virulence-associated E family protein, partial [Prevotella sp.]|nr:virulence-associated E family protein [Prevotella sp.]